MAEFGVDSALQIITRYLREGSDKYKKFGYDIHLPSLWEDYVRERDDLPATEYHEAANRGQELAPLFYAAAWDMCLRGLIRPGVRAPNTQVTEDGQGGSGYSYTPQGREFVEEIGETIPFIPTEPAQVANLFAEYRAMFGDGFHQRAQEAVRCYRSRSYLACCAMCGAASESILLAAAIAKSGDENAVIRTYRSASGRSKTVNSLIGQSSGVIAERLKMFMDLLNYWRDESGHGIATQISEPEADAAVTRLIRLSQHVSDNWTHLTK